MIKNIKIKSLGIDLWALKTNLPRNSIKNSMAFWNFNKAIKVRIKNDKKNLFFKTRYIKQTDNKIIIGSLKDNELYKMRLGIKNMAIEYSFWVRL